VIRLTAACLAIARAEMKVHDVADLPVGQAKSPRRRPLFASAPAAVPRPVSGGPWAGGQPLPSGAAGRAGRRRAASTGGVTYRPDFFAFL